jgi:hypothetical protein
MSVLDAQICYLLCFPDPVENSSEPPEQIHGLKDAPYFQPVDISVRTLGQAEVRAGGEAVALSRQRYDDRIQVVECRFPISDVLNQASIQKRENIESDLLKQLIPSGHLESGLFEEYIVLMVSTVSTADVFVEGNARRLAHFLRTQREELDEAEIEEILFRGCATRKMISRSWTGMAPSLSPRTAISSRTSSCSKSAITSCCATAC